MNSRTTRVKNCIYNSRTTRVKNCIYNSRMTRVKNCIYNSRKTRVKNYNYRSRTTQVKKMIKTRTWTHNSRTLCQLVCYCSLCPTDKSLRSVVFQVLTPCGGQACRWRWFGRTCLWKEETGSTVMLKWSAWQRTAITQAGCKQCGQKGPQKGQTGQTLLSGPTATAKVRVDCRTHHFLRIFSPPPTILTALVCCDLLAQLRHILTLLTSLSPCNLFLHRMRWSQQVILKH